MKAITRGKFSQILGWTIERNSQFDERYGTATASLKDPTGKVIVKLPITDAELVDRKSSLFGQFEAWLPAYGPKTVVFCQLLSELCHRDAATINQILDTLAARDMDEDDKRFRSYSDGVSLGRVLYWAANNPNGLLREIVKHIETDQPHQFFS